MRLLLLITTLVVFSHLSSLAQDIVIDSPEEVLNKKTLLVDEATWLRDSLKKEIRTNVDMKLARVEAVLRSVYVLPIEDVDTYSGIDSLYEMTDMASEEWDDALIHFGYMTKAQIRRAYDINIRIGEAEDAIGDRYAELILLIGEPSE